MIFKKTSKSKLFINIIFLFIFILSLIYLVFALLNLFNFSKYEDTELTKPNLTNYAIIDSLSDDEPSDQYLEDPQINIEAINNLEINNLTGQETFKKGETLIDILSRLGIDKKDSLKIAEAISPILPVHLIQIGDKLELYNSTDGALNKIILITKRSRIIVKVKNKNYVADLIKQSPNIKFIYKEFLIDDNFFVSSQKNSIPLPVINMAINLHSKNLNFERDINPGTFAAFYFSDDINLELEKIEKNKLLYSSIKTNNTHSEYFRYEMESNKTLFYDRNGVSSGSMKLIKPINDATISSPYGMRIHPISNEEKMHHGVDYAADLNAPIYAVADGIVDFIGEKGSFGKYIRLSHNNSVQSVYAHLNSFGQSLVKGSLVEQGDVIGYAGRTGLSTGVHLHFEIVIDKKRINPDKFDEIRNNEYLEGEELKKFYRQRDKINNELNGILKSKEIKY